MGVPLSDPNAAECAVRLYGFLCAQFGKRILTAQQESPLRCKSDLEMDYIRQTTGRLPAIRGLDFIHDDFQGVTERALRWHEAGGIVTICWHSGVRGSGYPDSQSETPDIPLLLAGNGGDSRLLYARWSQAADALERLQKAGVPVLWRPFHEFDGGWFWWGKCGGEAFIRLWREMHRFFTRERGLHNLIWVLGYADDVEEGWFPGGDCCDVLGSDTYKGVTTHRTAFEKLRALAPQKPLAFHECGLLPPVEDFYRENAVWSWLMPWHGKWLMQDNTPEALRAVYLDERMITLDDLKKIQ